MDELVTFAKENFNVTLKVDMSQLNANNIVAEFNKIKSTIDDLSSTANLFSLAGTKTGLANEFKALGDDTQAFYDVIINNKNSVAAALGEHIEKLKRIGGQQKAINEEQKVYNSLAVPKKESESSLQYLNRLIEAYTKLGLLGDNNKVFDQSYDQLRKLGLGGEQTFQTLNNLWGNIKNSSKDSARASASSLIA